MCAAQCSIPFSKYYSDNSLHPFPSRRRPVQYYTQGEPERDKARIERDAKSGVAKANQLVDEANARGGAGATEARAKASGIIDQTRAGWEQTKEKASQYAVSFVLNQHYWATHGVG